MKINSLYSVCITNQKQIFKETVSLYRHAVDFLISVCLKEWDILKPISNSNERMMAIEKMTHKTKNRMEVPYDFDEQFYKFPSYLRRSAIADAIGAVSSYTTRLETWKNESKKTRGSKPGYPKVGSSCPTLYKGDMFKEVEGNPYAMKIKVWHQNTWKWITVKLRKSDVDYILHHCGSKKRMSPTLQKRYKRWFLDFPFKEETKLHNKDIKDQRVLGVDLGLNSACACCVMESDGTILAREFLTLGREYDCLKRKTGRVRKAQRKGARKTRNLWGFANYVNQDIASKTANFIIGIAVKYDVDTIVFEHLNVRKKKRGSKKQRLHLWKANGVQTIVTDKAHRLGMRVSRICARNTSRLAFDGSGSVKRGKASDRLNGNYSLCEFSTGKVYNCDLNASYNIAARYYVREILKSIPAMERQHIEAKDPQYAKRSTCTLSTLINLNGDMFAISASNTAA